jgi:hypothetical protein
MVETNIDNNSLIGLCLVDETGEAVYKVRATMITQHIGVTLAFFLHEEQFIETMILPSIRFMIV